MQKILFAGLAFGALCNVALAEPMKLTEAQMGDINAGVVGTNGFVPAIALFVSTIEFDQQNAAVQSGEAAAVNLFGLGGNATAILTQSLTQTNLAGGGS